MLSYHYVPEQLNKRVLRILNIMLLGYILPLWMQLIYMGDASDATVERIMIWNLTLHPDTITLLIENLMMVIYVAVLEVVQERVRNFWLYLVAHLVCIGVMWCTLVGSDGRIPRLIVCIAFVCCALYARIHETHLGYPTAGWLGLGILMVITSSQTELHDMQAAGCAMEIASAVLSALYYNVTSVEHALEHTKGAGGVPYDKVRQTNLIVMLLWLITAVGLIALILLSGIGNAFMSGIGEAAIWCLRQVLRAVVYLLGLLPQGADSYQETAGMIEAFDPGSINPIESILMIVLMAIWETILALYRLVAFVLAIWAVVKCSKWLYKSFIAAEIEEHQSMFWSRAVERSVIRTRNRVRGLSPIDPSPAARMRYLYIQFIRKGDGFKNIQSSMTPDELMTVSVKCKRIIDQNVENEDDDHVITARIEQIRALYELARYMPEQCTYRNVQEMRSAIRYIQKELARWERRDL